jgi:hypothetical protein
LRRGDDALESQTPPCICCEAAEADVGEENVLGVDKRVGIRRGVRGGQLNDACWWHRLDGSGKLLPKFEHLSLRPL